MIAGRYTLDRELGRGGMGAVWLARDELLGRQVALKRLGTAPLGTGSADVDRAAREARLAAQLNHPHVVAVFDLVPDGNEHWLVMEYVEGSTLSALIRASGRLGPDQAAAIVAQVADALSAAHRSGVVHRDVKPSNILVQEDGQAKLSDFGIARGVADDATLTQTGLITGSPAYLAPEVASGRPATEASDVWSLGATLYHALAGQPPYEIGENVLSAMYRIVHEEPPRLPHAGWLAPLLAGTMVRDPAQRWTTTQVRDFLVAGPQPVPAPSLDPTTQVLAPAGTRPARRRRVNGTLGALVALALVSAVSVGALALGRGESGAPATSPAQALPSPSGPSEAQMRAFVRDYLTTAAADPEAGYAMLTPQFQRASGSLEGYRGFWGQVVEVSDVEVTETDLDTMQVGYRYRYRTAEGTREEQVRLELAWREGRFLIADEPR